jgi:hypothetical protein
VNSLNIVRMIVSPRSSHPSGVDVVRDNVAIVSELRTAESAFPDLRHDLSVEQFPHLPVGAEFAVSPRVIWILDPADTKLAGE